MNIDNGSTGRRQARVPVLTPQLPPADRLIPYLRRIDAARCYTNWGPLSAELETRLAAHLQLPDAVVTTAGSGTSALVGAILASAGRADPERNLAIIPAFSFVATAVAVEQCGYRPYLVDVDQATWMIQAQPLMHHRNLNRVGLVVPVAAFGCAVPQEPWRRFRSDTGIPVVIDGAASFDRLAACSAQALGEIPVALSFHATKSFATGEGGAVASTDAASIGTVARALNFGFDGSRDSAAASTNGKMSEYHAAIGLAELDGYSAKLAALGAVIQCYRQLLARGGLGGRLIGTPEIGASYVLFRCGDRAPAQRVVAALREANVDHRFWYGGGIHHQTYFADVGRDELTVTDHLTSSLMGLPLAPDLAPADIKRIVDALLGACEP